MDMRKIFLQHPPNKNRRNRRSQLIWTSALLDGTWSVVSRRARTANRLIYMPFDWLINKTYSRTTWLIGRPSKKNWPSTLQHHDALWWCFCSTQLIIIVEVHQRRNVSASGFWVQGVKTAPGKSYRTIGSWWDLDFGSSLFDSKIHCARSLTPKSSKSTELGPCS